ncbi:MAG: hypothetical protein RJB08_74 [Actinomycetota bacterium]
MRKAPRLRGGLFNRLIRRRPTLPGGLPPSTIGAGGLNCRVRDGNGCDPTAMATENCCQGDPQNGVVSLKDSRASTSVFLTKPSAD